MLRPSCQSILQGSVSWSPARSETAHAAPMLAPSFVVRRATKSRSFRPLLWIAASVWITAFAAAAWWQYGENDRSPLSSTDRGPSELKIAQLPAFTVLRTIDQPDVALLARGDAPEAPTVVTHEPAAYAEIPALPATGLVGIAQQRPELADVRQVATRAGQRSFRPRSGRSGKTGRRLSRIYGARNETRQSGDQPCQHGHV